MTATKEHDAEVAHSMNYPSPGAEAMVSGPFYNNMRDEVQDEHALQDKSGAPIETPDPEQRNHQPGFHDEHPSATDRHAEAQEHGTNHVVGELEHHRDHDHEHDHEAIPRPPNLEELQLAAQLGHGLTGASMMPSSDQNLHVDDPSLRPIMPHPEPDQHTPSYTPTPSSDHMVQHSLAVPIGPLSSQFPLNTDNVPPRKRSKVSRACDECRRKKIKCDAQLDTGEAPCSSCARSETACLFSRVPQKRGPSKGYIKELADRIYSIENKLESEGGGNLTQDDIDRLFGPNERPREEAARKRPFSSISGDFTSPASNHRQAPWGMSDNSNRALLPASEGGETYTNASLAPQSSGLKADETPSKQTTTLDIPESNAEHFLEVDEGALHDFLSNIQFVYPILPNTRVRAQELLSQCSGPLRTAFSTALLAVTQPSGGDAKLASALLNSLESLETTQSQATNIVHAQTLLLLIMDADARASSTLPFLLARAAALANSMKLWKFTPAESVSELDSDEQLCVRIWWSLVLMDRWHAAGTGKPSQIPDSSVVIPSRLESIVGEVCFHLIRLSKLLNRISFVISTIPPSTFTADPPMSSILADYIENYREDLPAHVDAVSYPLVHLAYWHCRLLVSLLTPGATPAETFWPTKELATLLTTNNEMRSPLINHFASLVTLALTKLSRVDGKREEVIQVIREVLEKGGTVWDSVRDRLSDHMRPSTGVEATASQGLQHLADLATSHGGENGQGMSAEELTSLVGGYLDMVNAIERSDGLADHVA